jgi:hypothetical protein
VNGEAAPPEQDPREPVLRGPTRAVVDQVFLGAAAMVGVSVTLLGLVGIISSLRSAGSLIDEMLAAVAMVFLLATLSAYLALRTTSPGRARLYVRVADWAFILGMIVIVLVGVLVAAVLI